MQRLVRKPAGCDMRGSGVWGCGRQRYPMARDGCPGIEWGRGADDGGRPSDAAVTNDVHVDTCCLGLEIDPARSVADRSTQGRAQCVRMKVTLGISTLNPPSKQTDSLVRNGAVIN